ncbi:hypothetical protein B5G43_08890 [Flavonifractor sp. An92]|uniref:LysR family transcriptional regulator n=1 Tax=Flavonifractor sp. An92 TaxID=1965666 RepID=UPI000B37E055|nr:LysR family transcriptional regulator [Flavonifractor sp. An92]OUN06514.1 hypothetical protein B5G43_08890 [Flavonifractor sp. An92]
MTLQQLRYFQAACRYHSITGAAEALHISQPSISIAIRELEHEFGLKLTARRYQGFSLTPEGEELLTLADGLLAHTDQVLSHMRDLSQRHYPIRLGMPPMVGMTLLPHLYTHVVPRHPDLTVSTREGGGNMLLRGLLEKTLDLAFITHDQPLGEEFQVLPLMSTETVWCVSRDHPMAGRTAVSVEELREEPLVLFQKNFFHYEIVMHRFEEAGVTPRVIHATDQLSTARRLIQSGIASGFLLKSALSEFRDLVGISLTPPIQAQLSLVWERNRHLSADMRCLIEDYQNLELT